MLIIATKTLLNHQLEELLPAGRGEAPATGRAAVVGSPIDHSLSPVLHAAAYAAGGLTGWSYERFAVGGDGEPDLACFLAGIDDLPGRPGDAGRGAPWRGFSVTMPLKEHALGLAAAVTERAWRLGAANTLLRIPDGWAADNTDTVGIRESLREVGVESAPHAVVLGSGATARSALGALSVLGTERVTVAVRSRVRPETVELATQLGMRVDVTGLADAQRLTAAVAAAIVTVSALPNGTAIHLPPAAPGQLTGAVLLDVVYGGWPSPLATWAGVGGARVLSGLPMLLHQAVEQVRLMTGRTPDVSAMKSALQAHTGPAGW